MLTLAQYKDFLPDAISRDVVDLISQGKEGSAQALASLPFTSNARLVPNGNSAAWTYRFYRRAVQTALAVREVNNEYAATTITAPVPVTQDLSIFGGKFEFDRVMSDASDIVGLIEENLQAKAIQVPAKFWDLAINGDAAVAGEYDGLDIVLTGSSTEYNAAAHIDLSSAANIEANWKQFRYEFRKFLRLLRRRPDRLFVNGDFLPAFAEMAQFAGAYSITVDEFGREVQAWNGIPFTDIGEVDGATDPIIPVEDRDYGSGNVTDLTDIYAICYGTKLFHGVAPKGGPEGQGNSVAAAATDAASDKFIKVYLPDMTQPGAVKEAELEVVATSVLEDTRGAGVFRNLKIG